MGYFSEIKQGFSDLRGSIQDFQENLDAVKKESKKAKFIFDDINRSLKEFQYSVDAHLKTINHVLVKEPHPPASVSTPTDDDNLPAGENQILEKKTGLETLKPDHKRPESKKGGGAIRIAPYAEDPLSQSEENKKA